MPRLALRRVVLLSSLVLLASAAVDASHATHHRKSTARTPAAQAADKGSTASAKETLSFGRFGKVALYRRTPQPRHVVLFVSGDGGWNLGVIDMARALSDLDALVVGIDIGHYLKAATAAKDHCTSAAVDFEALSQYIQKKLDRPEYTPPVLVGYSSGATLVYATLVQAPPSTFKGAISLGFCPDLPITKPFCAGHGLAFEPGPPSRKPRGVDFLPAAKLDSPFIALQGTIDETCLPEPTREFVGKVGQGEVVMLPKVGHGFSVQARWMPQFREVFARLTREAPKPPAPTPSGAPAGAPASLPSVADLPLVEVPAAGGASGANADRLAVIVSGDGGWAGIDREVGGALAARGIPVVGLNSLSYLWKAKTPEVVGGDLARILGRYLGVWHKRRAIVIGYSAGADILPFMLSRLPPDLQKQVELVALLGPEKEASFEFHVTQWLGSGGTSDRQVLPELRKLQKLANRYPILCLYGKEETESICPGLDPTLGKSIGFSGSHHFGGDYDALAGRILKELPER